MGLPSGTSFRRCALPQAGGDIALGAEILAGMSHQAVYLGEGTTGVDLARTARAAAEKAGVQALIAEGQVMAAHAHAVCLAVGFGGPLDALGGKLDP
ncbi:MAG: hypothetical protein ACRDQW_16000, partial [Haloechinothrix sp.]